MKILIFNEFPKTLAKYQAARSPNIFFNNICNNTYNNLVFHFSTQSIIKGTADPFVTNRENI